MNWTIAWVYVGMSILLTVFSRVAMIRKHPDLALERARYKEGEGVKSWDRVLSPLVGIYGQWIMLIVAGLDKRFGWSPEISSVFLYVAFAVALIGACISIWALVENRFFSAVVRIQKERGHVVCDTGLYHYIRHPGYAGGVLYFLATPFILGTMWALIPTMSTIVFTVIRTALEDNTLKEELEGYEDYAKRVRFRLMPGIW